MLARTSTACAFAHLLIFCVLLAAEPQPPGPVVFVQVSDIHANHLTKNPIVQDLQQLAQQVLKQLQPRKILLTGDLADSKTPQGRTLQSSRDWELYERGWRQLMEGAGLQPADMLDVRGNHDGFDMIREQLLDFFPEYSARAAAGGAEHAGKRVYLEELPQEGGACPAAVLLGIDVTPSIGLRSPCNFIGVVTQEFEEELSSSLAATLQKLASRGCQPPVVAYGHHPLSTTANQASSTSPAQALPQLLAQHGVAAYLNGHLHDLFGDMLHRLHAKGSTGLHMAELEAVDWKDHRHFRVMAADSGLLSFADLHFVPSTGTGTPARIVARDETQHVAHHVVLLTSPPDSRYAPLTPADLDQETYSQFRVLVLPVLSSGDLMAAAVKDVQLHWSCQSPGQAEPLRGILEMNRAASNPRLFQRELSAIPDCSDIIIVQVHVRDGKGKVSRSAQQMVFASADAARQGPTPMGTTWLEKVVLHVPWAAFGRRTFTILWAAHFVGGLLLPRLLCGQLLLLTQRLAEEVWAGTPAPLSRRVNPTAAGLMLSMAKQLAAVLGLLLLWPFRIAARLSKLEEIWMWMVAYDLNLFVGPWFLGRFQSHRPLCAFTAFGVVMPAHSTTLGFALYPTPDRHIITVVHMLTCVIPLSLWLASLVGYWMDAAAADKLASRHVITIPHAITGVMLAYIHVKALEKLSVSFGWGALLMSPAVGWVLPLILLALRHARRALTKNPALATRTSARD